jgi:dihydroxyacetone kinase-like protein
MGDLMAELTAAVLTRWLHEFRGRVAAHVDELTALDSAIGDADHGANLDRGTAAVVAALDAAPAAKLDDLFKRTGMTLVSSVGGASGPLFGTFFLRIGASLGSVASTTAADFGVALSAGLGGVEARGKSALGEKTLLDALAPAIDAWDSAVAKHRHVPEVAQAAAEAAAAGRDATAPLVATKGRASYLGERSVGHVDPGAASVALLFDALVAAVAGVGK